MAEDNAPDKFACEIVFAMSSKPDKDRFTFFGGKLVSTVIDLEGRGAGIEQDIFSPNIVEDAQLNTMPDGIYFVFICGTVAEDKEVEIPPGNMPDWIFIGEFIRYLPLSSSAKANKMSTRDIQYYKKKIGGA